MDGTEWRSLSELQEMTLETLTENHVGLISLTKLLTVTVFSERSGGQSCEKCPAFHQYTFDFTFNIE